MLNYTLHVYKQDRRRRSGERLVSTQVFEGVSSSWMAEEVSYLYRTKYTKDYRLDWNPTYAYVKNLQSGNTVEIPWEDQGTHMDPSQERYWSM